VLDDRRYTEIIMTRATVSVGEDIGFLPGTEEEKMGPWMGALDDNLEFLAKGDGGNAGEWGRAATNELIRSRIKIKSMNFMRGRTFLNKYVIIDEAQNLTPKQMKTLITRAGPGTKIICMGNLAQIDTPYLTEGSSGLTYAVDASRAGRTAATSRWRAASARAWPTSPARCCNEWAPRIRMGRALEAAAQKSSLPPEARLSNRVSGLRKASLTVPVGPLRCLPMMTSATPGSLSPCCSSRRGR
jgi:hypothetical protein